MCLMILQSKTVMDTAMVTDTDTDMVMATEDMVMANTATGTTAMMKNHLGLKDCSNN